MIHRRRIAGLLLLASCAAAPKPVVVPNDQIPFPLSRSAPKESSAVTRSEVLYLVRNGRLLPIVRRLEATGSREASIVRVLFAGPDGSERSHGVTTAIPASTRLLGVHIDGAVATVNVSEEFQEPAPPQDIRLRVGQIVFTLTRLPNVDAVRFQVDGTPIEVVPDAGVPTARPIRRSDLVLESPER